MFRIDFGRCMLENIKDCSCLCFYMSGLGPAYAAWIHAYAALFLHTQVCSWGSTYVGMGLRMQGPVCVHGLWPAYMRRLVEALLYPFLLFFICFTSVCNPNTPFCHFCTWISLYPSFYLNFCFENIIFHQFCLNQESNVIFFFCSHHPFMLVGEALLRW